MESIHELSRNKGWVKKIRIRKPAPEIGTVCKEEKRSKAQGTRKVQVGRKNKKESQDQRIVRAIKPLPILFISNYCTFGSAIS